MSLATSKQVVNAYVFLCWMHFTVQNRNQCSSSWCDCRCLCFLILKCRLLISFGHILIMKLSLVLTLLGKRTCCYTYLEHYKQRLHPLFLNILTPCIFLRALMAFFWEMIEMALAHFLLSDVLWFKVILLQYQCLPWSAHVYVFFSF